MSFDKCYVPCMSHPENIPHEPFEQPPQCMPDEFKVQDDPVKAYRRYYRGGKHYMNAGRGPLWRKARNAPTWF